MCQNSIFYEGVEGNALIDFIPIPWNFKLSTVARYLDVWQARKSRNLDYSILISDQRQMGWGKKGSLGLGSTIWQGFFFKKKKACLLGIVRIVKSKNSRVGTPSTSDPTSKVWPLAFRKCALVKVLDRAEMIFQLHLAFFSMSYTLFIRSTITLFRKKKIFKIWSHGTIYTFKNYFVTIFSVFNNKQYSNRPQS